MGKKTSARIIAKFSPKYRWEFLRRNEDYLRFYKKVVAYRKSPGYSKDFEKSVFYIGWGLTGAIDPSKSYEENVKLAKGDMFLPRPVLIETDKPKSKHILEGRFKICLSFPKRTILWSIEQQIGHYFKAYKKTLKKTRKAKVKESRTRIGNYKRYLEIFDLCKAGWSHAKLAKKFYPGEIERGNLSYAKMLVKRDYDRCNELIKIGYQHLR